MLVKCGRAPSDETGWRSGRPAGSAGDFRRCCSCCAGASSRSRCRSCRRLRARTAGAAARRRRRHPRGRCRHLAAALGPLAAVIDAGAHPTDARRSSASTTSSPAPTAFATHRSSSSRSVGSDWSTREVRRRRRCRSRPRRTCSRWPSGDQWKAIAAWSVVYVLPSVRAPRRGDRVGLGSPRSNATLVARSGSELPQAVPREPAADVGVRLGRLALPRGERGGDRRTTDTRRDEFLAMRVTDIRPPDDVRAFLDEIAIAPALHHSPVAWRHVLKDGRTIEVDITAHRLEFKGRAAMLTAVQDVTERNGLERELRHRAFHDALTDLANRSLFANRMEHALGARRTRRQPDRRWSSSTSTASRRSTTASVTPSATSCCSRSASACADAVRPGDTVGPARRRRVRDPARGRADDRARRRPGRAHRSTRWPSRSSSAGKSLVVTASVGRHAQPAGRRARRAGPQRRHGDVPGEARRQGRACARFEPALHHAALDRLELEAELRRALQRDELVVHYQPTVAARRPARSAASRRSCAGSTRTRGLLGAARVHPARRGDRPHHRDRALGARARRAARRAVAADARDRDAHDLGQPVGPPARATRTSSTTSRRDARASPGSQPERAHARDHRDAC